MNVTQALQARRAIKKYDTQFKIPEDDFKDLMDKTLAETPSSFNIQHWRVVDVKDDKKRADIRAAAWDQAQITEASKLLVLCADVKAWNKNTEQYWKEAPQEVSDMMVPMTKDFYEGREWIQRDEALRSIGILSQSIILMASEKGLDTCPMIGFDQDEVGKIINLPDDHLIGMIIVMGKRREEPFKHGGVVEQSTTLIQDSF